ncbi:MAG: tRNA uridine-5-carboxymethylaminomethyl(34) synthesis GTPase MnmE [Candidatus Omnitrophota bacterium]
MSVVRWEDTIVAIATPPGEGGLAVIRLSGPEALTIAGRIFHSSKNHAVDQLPSQTLHFGQIRDGNSGLLDQVLLAVFRKPHSYTGENVAEISIHGGIGVSRLILELAIRHGARHAEPGEFTQRAFLNGRIDLTQAEAVADLIHAKSKAAVETAARQVAGSLSRNIRGIKEEIMRLYAHLEAYLDFPEEDIEVFGDREILGRFRTIREQLETLAASFKRGSLLREGALVALAGRPNVGKSSLFNALLERDRALVSPIPGTTRDHLEEALEIQGLYIRLADTAGLAGAPKDVLDGMGIEKTRHVLSEAHTVVHVLDASEPLSEEDHRILRELSGKASVITLLNKSDLENRLDLHALRALIGDQEPIRVSAKTRQNLEVLEGRIFSAVTEGAWISEGEALTRVRHKTAVEAALQAMSRAETGFRAENSLEIVTIELKTALDALRELIGEVYTEDLLDVIFSEFCIGK